jgi:hypothetical protein
MTLQTGPFVSLTEREFAKEIDMKRAIIASIVVAAFAVSVAHGRRSAPKGVPPVTKGSIQYRAPRSHMGCIEAWDKARDKLMWRRQIYVVKYDTTLERDVQDVFVKEMKLKENVLVVTNERNSEYQLDLKSLEVKVVNGSLVEEVVLKQTSRFKCAGCGLVYEKCSSCGLGSESHSIVNHPPVHEGCNGYGQIIREK